MDVTERKPEGPTSPGCENKFSYKFKGEHPVALDDVPQEMWYTRTITRGDRFSKHIHFEKVSAPNVAADNQDLLRVGGGLGTVPILVGRDIRV